MLEEYKEEAKRRAGVDVDWTTLDGYFRRLGKSGTSINIASSVSPQQVRKVVVGFDDRPATKAEIEQMTQPACQGIQCAQSTAIASDTETSQLNTRCYVALRLRKQAQLSVSKA